MAEGKPKATDATAVDPPAEGPNSTTFKKSRRSRSLSQLFGSKKKSINDGRYDHFIAEKIDNYPRGYPQVAAYIAADIDGRLYRRFAHVRNRLLLHLQDEVCELETQLSDLDSTDACGDSTQSFRLLSRRYDEEDLTDCPRRKILDALHVKLKDYDALLLREHAIMSLRRPSTRFHRVYFNYIWDEKPLYKDEYQFIYRADDFVALGEHDDDWLVAWTDALDKIVPKTLLKFILSPRQAVTTSSSSSSEPEETPPPGESSLTFYSNERTELLITTIISAASTLLLIVPIAVFYVLAAHKASSALRIGMLSIFIVIFAVVLASLTKASRHETFAASAGYAAVLVVFLGGLPTPPGA